MRKRNALVFISAIMFLYLFCINSATMNKNASSNPNLFSELYGAFHKKILYPAMSRSDENIITATAVCVDGKEIVILKDIQQAKQLVRELSLYISSFFEGTMVSAVPKGALTYRTAPYPKEEITDYDTALFFLKGTPKDSGYYKVEAGDTKAAIAQKFGISEKALSLLNPSCSFAENEKVLVVIPSPVLSLEITMQKIERQSVPVEYKYEYDPSLSASDRRIESYGQAGVYEITQTVIYEDFIEVSRKTDSKTIISEPKPQIIKVGTMPPVSSGRFIRPVNGGEITSSFGLRERDDHKGVDIGLDHGSPIHASDGGIVITSDAIEGYGNTVIIDHKNGYTTLYAHCDTLLVSQNQSVVQGEQIATVGSTGISTGPHLHFEILKDNIPQNPENYIKF